jgi:alpha-beta hydrolase superfamily lysophospholipase
MKKDSYMIQGTDGQQLFVRRYEGSEKGKGVIQILHGMAEYGDRYDGFAQFLTEQGYVVYIHDHRKHGKSISGDQKVGYFKDDTWVFMVEDIELVQQDIVQKENCEKVIMIGHSMGSFLLRTYLMDHGERVSKAVLSGTGITDIPLSKAGLLAAKLIRLFSPDKPSVLLNNMTVGPYNKPFKPNRTEVDWLTRDNSIVDWYVKSPLCGYAYTPRFYEEIVKGLLYIIKNVNILKTPKIPILFISGDNDPVGGHGVGVTKIRDIYKSLGYNTEMDLIKDARHEILNELNKDDIYRKILKFIEA